MKKPQQSLNAASQRSKIDHIDDILPSHPLPSVNQARDKGARSLLTSLPLREQGLLALNKQEFRDSLRMGHNLPLEDLPISCTRGSAFQSIMLCTLVKKAVWFVPQKHVGIQHLLTNLLGKACNKVEAEPHLIPFDNEHQESYSSSSWSAKQIRESFMVQTDTKLCTLCKPEAG